MHTDDVDQQRQMRITEEGLEIEDSPRRFLGEKSELSKYHQPKIMGGNQGNRNAAHTAANSQTLDAASLGRDASRQYLDVNFSIGDSVIGGGPGGAGILNNSAILNSSSKKDQGKSPMLLEGTAGSP